MSMSTSGWVIKQFDLTINTVESRINTGASIYKTPYAVLKELDSLCSNVDISAETINYTIPKNELTIGHLLYMKPDDHKIICQWDNTKYIIIMRVQINSVQ